MVLFCLLPHGGVIESNFDPDPPQSKVVEQENKLTPYHGGMECLEVKTITAPWISIHAEMFKL